MRAPSNRKLAEALGVSETAVRKALAVGRISRDADGSFDVARVKRQWAGNTDASQQRRRPGTSAPVLKPVPAAAVDSVRETLRDQGGEPVGGSPSFLQARTANEVLKAQERRLRLQRLKGELIDRARATAQVFTLARQERDAWGAMAGARADQIERTNDAISRLGLVWRGLSNQLAVAAAPALEAVADAMAALSRTTGPLGQAFRALFDNIGRLASSAAAFAAFIAGRWVAGMVVAAASVRGLATALVLLRGALIRTGIGALVVAAGELIYQFGGLVQASGGFGAALSLLGDVAAEVWDRVGILTEILQARIVFAWNGIQASVAEALQGALEAVVSFGNQTVSTFQGAFDATVVIWSNLPATIGDVTIQAPNAPIAGLEAMLNGAVGVINRLLESVNAGLAAIGVERPITLVPEIDLGRIENEVVGAAGRAGTAASEAFAAAFETNAFNAPDLGLSTATKDARAAADRARDTAAALAELAGAPLASVAALREAMAGATGEIDNAAAATDRLDTAFDAIGGSAGGTSGEAGGTTGSAGRAAAASSTAGQAIGTAADQAATGWAAVRDALARYADDAMDWGKGVGSALTSAFRSAEDALASFVTTGKIDFKGLADSIQADITRIAIRSTILGPIAGALAGAGGGLSGGQSAGGGLLAGIFHQGGIVGGPTTERLVSALAFAGASRLHDGGMAGLRADEVPAILQRGEMVLSRAQVAAMGSAAGTQRPVTVVMNITTPDAASFRQRQGQIAADAARAIERARRNL